MDMGSGIHQKNKRRVPQSASKIVWILRVSGVPDERTQYFPETREFIHVPHRQKRFGDNSESI
jgi:hypothetical protein